jgi:hypothetical protein
MQLSKLLITGKEKGKKCFGLTQEYEEKKKTRQQGTSHDCSANYRRQYTLLFFRWTAST